MATKTWAASFLDPALNYLKGQVNRIVLCSAEPTTYTEAVSTFSLANSVVDSGDLSGPADGDVSGRKLSIARKDGITVGTSGTARFFALVNSSSTELVYVGRLIEEVALLSAEEISIPGATVEILDPF